MARRMSECCCWRSPPLLLRMDGCRHRNPARVSVEDSIATAPVEIDGAELFRLRGVSSYPAEVRARSVRDRIVAAAADPAVSIDSLRVVETGSVVEIAAGDQPLLAHRRCRCGSRAGRARGARARAPGAGASGNRRVPRRAFTRSAATSGSQHAGRHPPPRARHRAGLVVLASAERGVDASSGGARP